MSRLEDLITARRLHRRHLLRLMGVGSAGLLAACASQSSTGGNATSTTSSGAATSAPAATTASAAATAAATTAPTAAAAAKKKGGTLTIGLDQEPPTMDPHASPSAITFYITASTAESLLYLDDKRQIQPWLASKYEVAPDAMTFTYTLVTDATFQEYNFDRIVDPNYKAGGALGSLSGYTGTDTPDDKTAVVKFKAAFVPFLTYSAGGTLAMVSPKTTPTQGDAVNTTPVLSGPYKISEYVAKDHCTITRWDDYKRKLPWASQPGPGYLDKVIWKFIPEAGTRTTTVQSGETQAATVIAAQDLPTFEGNKNFYVMKPAWVGTPEIWMLTVDHPPTDDQLRDQQAGDRRHRLQGNLATGHRYPGQIDARRPLAAELPLRSGQSQVAARLRRLDGRPGR
jgi:peptide/nickel transport system substrate-binding protein